MWHSSRGYEDPPLLPTSVAGAPATGVSKSDPLVTVTPIPPGNTASAGGGGNTDAPARSQEAALSVDSSSGDLKVWHHSPDYDDVPESAYEVPESAYEVPLALQAAGSRRQYLHRLSLAEYADISFV